MRGPGVLRLPRQFAHRLKPGAQHRALARGIRHALKPPEFLFRELRDVLGHARRVEGLPEFLDLRGAVVRLAQFLLDLAHLLAQHVLALALIERLPGLFAYPRRNSQHLDACAEDGEHPVEALPQVKAFEQRLFFLDAHIHEIDHEVGQGRGRSHALHHTGKLVRRLRQEAQCLGGALLQLVEARLDVRILLVAGGFRCRDARDQERPAFEKLKHAKALLPLHHDVVRALGAGDIAQHLPAGAHPEKIRWCRVVLFASRWRRKPMRRSALTESWAAATDFSRPNVTGATMPGNSSMLRSGTIAIASAGRGLAPFAESVRAAFDPALPVSCPAASMLVSISSFMAYSLLDCNFSEREREAPVDQRAPRGFESVHRQGNPPEKAPVGNFYPVQPRTAGGEGKRANGRNSHGGRFKADHDCIR